MIINKKLIALALVSQLVAPMMVLAAVTEEPKVTPPAEPKSTVSSTPEKTVTGEVKKDEVMKKPVMKKSTTKKYKAMKKAKKAMKKPAGKTTPTPAN